MNGVMTRVIERIVRDQIGLLTEQRPEHVRSNFVLCPRLAPHANLIQFPVKMLVVVATVVAKGIIEGGITHCTRASIALRGQIRNAINEDLAVRAGSTERDVVPQIVVNGAGRPALEPVG